LGDPWVTQASPKGHARATQAWRKGGFAEVLLFATKAKKGRVGVKIAVIARDRRHRAESEKQKPYQ
jgi:hypothetical protein